MTYLNKQEGKTAKVYFIKVTICFYFTFCLFSSVVASAIKFESNFVNKNKSIAGYLQYSFFF